MTLPHPPAQRIEHDLLGERSLPADALYGIHTLRALENFPLSGRGVHPALIHAFGAVKLACVTTNARLGYLDAQRAQALIAAARELQAGQLDAHIVVDALQGGAGTSTNMNVNEVLANRALLHLGRLPGDYDTLHPLTHVNLHQSTNDTYPTALRVAAIVLLRRLEQAIVSLVEAFHLQEHAMADVVKVGRTQMQDAVLLTLGREMSAYAQALARDRWRVYKCEERLRVVNLGGTAVGTGLCAPRDYIFQAVETLREITGLGLARAENLVEATQNADVYVEVSGILCAMSANLHKISGDLRLLSSGPQSGLGEIHLPQRQAGSSIMPGKVNPVIPEAVTQAALMCQAQHQAITQAAGLGSLELNPFLPLIADALLSSLTLLTNACDILCRHCVTGLSANQERCRAHVAASTATLTALVPYIGHAAAESLAAQIRQTGGEIRALVVEQGLMTPEDFEEAVSAARVLRLGSTDTEQPT